MEAKEVKALRLESQARLGQLIKEFYTEAHEVGKNKSRPIAWVSVGAPSEILWAMDFFCLFPEAHSATCSGRRVGDYHCQVTEAKGYEVHLCTYARNDLGWVLAGPEHKSPVGGLPRPDLLVCANNSCLVIQKWMENQSRYLKVPLVIIDTPYITGGILIQEATAYVKQQCLDLITFLERMTGRKFDYDRFAEVVKTSERSSKLYQQIFALNKVNPPPVALFDLWAHNFPNLCFRYTEKSIRHYELLKAEIEQRIAAGMGAFPGIKYRIYWDGVVSWFAMGSLSRKLSSLGLCLTASTYSHVFGFPFLDGARPLESVAEGVALLLMNRDVEYKKNFIKQMFAEYSLDGGIFEYALTCKPFTITQAYLQEVIREELGKPTVSFEADLTDSRFYSEEEAYLRFEALAEELDAQRGAKMKQARGSWKGKN